MREHPDSLAYDHDTGRDVFFDLLERAGRADVLIAYLPEASMGTAIELWNAHHAGAYIVCVSGLTKNWVVRYLADMMLPDMDALREVARNGALGQAIRTKLGDNPLTV